MRKLTCVLFICVFITTNLLAESNCYFRFNSKNKSYLFKYRQQIESFGARIIHEFPPNEFICEMHHKLYIKFTEENKDLVSQCYSDGNITDISKYDGETDIGQFCWEYIKDINKIDLKTYEDTVKRVPFKCGTNSDITIQKDTDYKMLEPNTVSQSDMFNANYLVGKTAVCIVLPESVGDTENWTTLQQDTAIAQIVLAYDKLTTLANERYIDVTWVYEIHRSIPVDEEPIEHERPSLYTPVPYILNWG